jgi:hypothetical protein
MAAARRPSLRQSSSRFPRGSDENIKALKFTRHAPWRLHEEAAAEGGLTLEPGRLKRLLVQVAAGGLLALVRV